MEIDVEATRHRRAAMRQFHFVKELFMTSLRQRIRAYQVFLTNDAPFFVRPSTKSSGGCSMAAFVHFAIGRDELELGAHLAQRLLTPDRFDRHPRFESRTVLFSRNFLAYCLV
jgi:hypothetical protein